MFSTGSDLTAFTSSIASAFDEVHTYLVTLLIRRYNFLYHAESLKKYLLLSAGDFASSLLDLVGTELDKSARDLSNAQILGILEAAKRASSVRTEPEDIAARISVHRMAPKKDENGWELFTLEYLFETDSPLRTIFTEKLVGHYSLLFSFLWQLKRVESRLNESWAIQTKLGHSNQLRQLGLELGAGSGMNELEPFLRNVAGLRNEMAHFISNLHSYVMFEVLECSWEEFVKKVDPQRRDIGKGFYTTNTTATMNYQQFATASQLTVSTRPQSAIGSTVPASASGGVAANGFNEQVGGVKSLNGISTIISPTSSLATQQLTSPSSSNPSAVTSHPPKPLDLDGLIYAHKMFIQQVVDKALMGGSSGALHPHMLTLFDLILSFTTFHSRLYSFLTSELTRRQELARAAARSADTGKWTTGLGRQDESKRLFILELSGCVREFGEVNHRFHSSLLKFHRALKDTNRKATDAVKRVRDYDQEDDADGEEENMIDESTMSNFRRPPTDFLGTPQPSAERKARRMALHLHSLDFLRFRLDFNEFYAVNKKTHASMISAYEKANQKVNPTSSKFLSTSTSRRPTNEMTSY